MAANNIHISTTNVFKSTMAATKSRPEKIEFAFVVTQSTTTATGTKRIAEVQRFKTEGDAEAARKKITRAAKRGTYRVRL